MPGGQGRLEPAVRSICEENLGLSARELLLVVADPPRARLAGRLVRAAREAGYRCELLEIGALSRAGEPPASFSAEALSRAGAALLVTSKSLSHTDERRRACREHGVRIASLPGLTEDMLRRLFPSGAARITALRTGRLAERLAGAHRAAVRTPRGTDLELALCGRRLYLDSGLYLEPGRFGNLPAGEVAASPVPGSARGRLVVDVAFAGVGAVAGLILELRGGMITRMSGPGSRRLGKLLAGAAERVLGEFGIGSNPLARKCARTLEAEKAVGTVHFGFGDNLSFGGDNRASGHWDAVISCDRLEVDGMVFELLTEE